MLSKKSCDKKEKLAKSKMLYTMSERKREESELCDSALIKISNP